MSAYLKDNREASFFLWELFKVDKEFIGIPPFDQVSREDCENLWRNSEAHASRLSSAWHAGDENPAYLDGDGKVVIPKVYHDLWDEHLRDWFWMRYQGETVSLGEERPVRYPHLLLQLISEQFGGSNASFMTYCGFTPGAYNLIRVRGTDLQREVFCDPLRSVRWDACFCATESEAGSELTAIRTNAEHIEGEIYSVQGEKCYITAGSHELTENTVYLVLGRIKGARANSMSLSCFIVPRYWPGEGGELLDNNVSCTHVERKMGLSGCANTRLAFGADGVTRGYLLGDRPNVALLQLAMLMRKARIGTGSLALALASSAYLRSLTYARARIQGAPFDQASNSSAVRVPIIEHRDVQRMLLEMRSKVEGCRTLIGAISFHSSKMAIELAKDSPDREVVSRHSRLAMLYSPIAKAYISDQAWRITELAIQVHGAVGYFRDLPLEQYARDVKILSIWEGTNYIQSQDLVRDKLGFGRKSIVMREFEEDIRDFLSSADSYPSLQSEFTALTSALDALLGAMEAIAGHADEKRLLLVSQYCTRILEMFGEIMVGWGLLRAAVVASERLNCADCTECDLAFYRGKVKTTQFFIRNILPGVHTKANLIANAVHGYVELESGEFGFLNSGFSVKSPSGPATSIEV
ncbi:MAG: acyl-CoA dehydrogenase [Parvularculaceae bacterium]